jgi:hypothetical protein
MRKILVVAFVLAFSVMSSATASAAPPPVRGSIQSGQRLEIALPSGYHAVVVLNQQAGGGKGAAPLASFGKMGVADMERVRHL